MSPRPNRASCTSTRPTLTCGPCSAGSAGWRARWRTASRSTSSSATTAPPARVLTDEVALTSILRNLLSNGIKYTDSGEVRLSARVAGTMAQISVSDTGIGIPASLHAQVFEEFYQVPGVRRGGTGLGLPYASRLARILGGDLELTSEPGVGTTVVLNLPHGTPAVGTVVRRRRRCRLPAATRGDCSRRMTDRLIEAEDGHQALAIIAGNPVDLVLADMRMPGLDGGALLARLPASVPAIIITGADVPRPPRAAALLRKDELTSERLEFTIRGVTAGRQPDDRRPGTVLVVDDDEAKRYILTTWLRRAGHTVIEAATGREALELAGAAELVLLDVNLPDMSGYEVCQADQGRPADRGPPGGPGLGDRGRGLRPGPGPDPGRRRLPDRADRTRGTARRRRGRAALLPGPAARRADGLPAGRADQDNAAISTPPKPSTG